MKPEAQRIAIAGACGWKCIDNSGIYGPLWWEREGVQIPTTKLPDYPNDLNAMHEVEKLFEPKVVADLYKEDRFEKYSTHLWFICMGHFGGTLRATAAQRCEAFLKTIGRWKDERKCKCGEPLTGPAEQCGACALNQLAR